MRDDSRYEQKPKSRYAVNDGPETLHITWGFDKPELIEVGIIWDE